MIVLIGKKQGMSRVFDADGKAVAVTVVKIEPNIITNIKDDKNDFQTIQIAAIKIKKLNKPQSGHLKKSTNELYSVLKEFKSEKSSCKVGDKISVSDLKENEEVSVSGVSKGKGFAGVIKRHNFHRGPKTHGSDHHRKPGSIGSMFPQHVLKGQKMPGRMGAEKVTVKNLKIISVDVKEELALISGAVPGNRGSVVFITQ